MTRTLAARALVVLAAATLVTAPTVARAQPRPSGAPSSTPSASSKTAAEQLFVEGRKLMDDGHYPEACEKLARSQSLDPSAGTLLNLADCYEKDGQTASAWTAFRGAAKAASDRKRTDWEKLATKHAAQLEPKLIMLVITSRAAAETEIVCDGAVVERPALGQPVPRDPGLHVVEARAKGKRPFRAELRLDRAGQRVELAVPPLEDETTRPGVSAALTPSPTPPPARDAGADATPPREAGRGDVQRTVGLVTGVAGIVGLGAGAAFGLLARSALNDAKAGCASYPVLDAPGCNDAGVASHNDDAKRFSTFSSIGFVAGGVLLAGGVVLWLTAPREKSGIALVPAVDASHASGDRSAGIKILGAF